MQQPKRNSPHAPTVKEFPSKTASRKKTKKLEVMVADVIEESPEATTLHLFTGNDHLDYQPGHFLTIQPHQFLALERFIPYFEEAKGKREAARAYSIASAPHEKHLAITIKEESFVPGRTLFPPLLSPLLVRQTPRGTHMKVTGFGGPYVLPPDIETKTDHLVHLCAGSGIVPNMSIIKHALTTEMHLRHTLVYGNKTYEDIIYRRELEELAHRYPTKLKVVHALSREVDASRHGPSYSSGRVDFELIREFIQAPDAVEVFTCGPAITRWERRRARSSGVQAKPRFMESVIEALQRIEVPKERIHRETYG